jgi:UDP-N-acetylglucosamine 2-epimerase (non-hydrolysing)
MKKRILIVVGTRPNFIKVTQFKKLTLENNKIELKIVHTGQHYDAKMADVFFEQFNLIPDFFLNIKSGSPTSQMAEIMQSLEKVCLEYNPELMMVVGDVNSTLAAALTANKLNIKVAHLESGLRSFDRSMPEETNRILTDELTDYFFVTEQSGWDHLLNEGKKESQLFFVGNTMIDTMVAFNEQIQNSQIIKELNLENEKFVLMTIHRPATVDVKEELDKLIQIIEYLSDNYKIVFPIHPRTINNLKKYNLYEKVQAISNLILSEPLDYFAFQKLIADCTFILTDSGGIQEESTFRLKPCITLRPNTERPSTIKIGTNSLLPFDIDEIKKMILNINDGNYKKGNIPPLWDGKSTERIVAILNKILN